MRCWRRKNRACLASGGIFRPSRRSRSNTGDHVSQKRALRGQGARRHPTLHGGRSLPTRTLRPQTGARKTGGQAAASLGNRRPALRIHPSGCGRAWTAVQVRETRPERNRNFRGAPVPEPDCRRHRAGAILQNRPVQPCAGADFHEHRLFPARASEHWLVDHLRTGLRIAGSAGLRGDEHGQRGERRGSLLVQRVPPDDSRGHAFPQSRRPHSECHLARRGGRLPPAGHAGRGAQPQRPPSPHRRRP